MERLEITKPNRSLERLGITVGLAMMFLTTLLLGLQVLPPAHADPGILYVDGASGLDIPTCGTTSVPCKTISYTLNSRASNGDIIRVAQGVYTENLTVDKQVAMEGGYAPSGTLWLPRAGETLIDGSNSRTVWGDWDGGGVHMSIVISDIGTYKMWYAGWGLRGQGFGLATSPHGITWTKYASNPVFTATVDWEQGSIGHPHVIKDGTTYEMWYGPNDERIGYAWSSDGIHWTKYANNPVLEGTPGAWDEGGVGAPFVIKLGPSDYRMWYQSGGRIGYATSTNGVEWTKHISPVLTPGPDGAWDDSGVWDPNVLYQGGLYHMWYAGYDGDTFRIGYASSSDGINWNKSASNPVLSFGAPGEWDEGGVSEPNVLFDGVLYRMWFSGWQSGWQNQQRGYATSLNGVNWTKYANNPVLSPGAPGQWGQPVLAFTSGSDGSVLDGFTVRNGETEYGGGVHIDSASPIISGCVIVENRAYTAGGGVFVTGDASPIIIASQILSNTAQDGAGLAIYDGATPLIDNNTIISNTADWAGGGIRVIASGGTIQNNYIASNKARGWAGGAMEIAVNAWTAVMNNSIVGNEADTGGGIAVNWHCKTTIAANEIVSNSTTDWAGGGIYIGDYSVVTIDRNMIKENRAESGSGIAINNGSNVTVTNNVIASNWEGDGVLMLNSNARIINNTIAFNAAEGVQIDSSDVDLRSNIVVSNTNCGINVLGGAVSTVTLEYNDLWGNIPQNYCNSSPGATDISVNPGFVDAASGNFHLRFESPCVDAGTNVDAPNIDFDGDSRPIDGDLDGAAITDIGADEFRPYRIYLPLTLKDIGQ